MRKELLRQLYLSDAGRNRGILYLCAIAMIGWAGADYWFEEPLWQTYFLYRVGVAIPPAIFLLPVFRNWHATNPGIPFAVTTFFLNVCTFVVLLTAQRMEIYAVAYSVYFVCTAFLVRLPMLYFIPSVVVPVVATTLFFDRIDANPQVDVVLFIATYVTLIICAMAGIYYNTVRELQLVQLGNHLEEKSIEAEKGKRSKEQLLRILSHDLSNISTVIDNAVFFLKGQLDKSPIDRQKVERFFNQIEGASKAQSEILAFVRTNEAMESGKISMELTPVCMDEVIEYALFVFSTKLEEKHLELQVECSLPPEEVYVQAEPTSFKNQVFNNLISNAIKFSRVGGRILVSVEREAANVTIKVADHGIGMPERILQNVFNPYAKTSRKGTNGEKGTGFGMPLVHAFVQNFGGTITVKSAPDEGTEFKIVLGCDDWSDLLDSEVA